MAMTGQDLAQIATPAAEVPQRGFPAAEFADRTRRAQRGLQDLGLSGMLLTGEAELAYFTGFQTLFWQSPTRPWFLFVPCDGRPVAIVPEIGAHLMRQTWIDDVRTWPAPRPSDDGISLLQECLAPFADRQARIGVLKGHGTHLRMPLEGFEALLAALPSLILVDATAVVRRLRMVKSAAEIAKIRHACAIGGRAFARICEVALSGRPLVDVFRAMRMMVLSEGADDVPYLVGGAEAGGVRDVISPPGSSPIARGDVLMLDLGARWDGYFCDFDRTWSIGPPDAATRRAYDRVFAATDAGLSALRPGLSAAELFAVMARALGGDAGDIGRLGHGLGLQLTEWPSLAPWEDVILTENMVLTLEPSLSYGDGRIMVLEENVVLRADGAELLTPRAPAEMPRL